MANTQYPRATQLCQHFGKYEEDSCSVTPGSGASEDIIRSMAATRMFWAGIATGNFDVTMQPMCDEDLNLLEAGLAGCSDDDLKLLVGWHPVGEEVVPVLPEDVQAVISDIMQSLWDEEEDVRYKVWLAAHPA